MNVLKLIEETMEKDRALSLQCRFDNENLLLEKAMKKPLFGWGPNGRNLVTREDGTIESIPDGLWVIAIGSNGIVGLCALYGALLLPVVMVKRRFRAAHWGDPMLAGVACFAVLLTLHALDNLMNAMLNPLFILGLGGLAGIVAASPVDVRGTRRAPAPARAGYRPVPA
jgi:O-antigen ligase